MNKLKELWAKLMKPKFNFRYNKLTGEFLTISIQETEEWDKAYLDSLEKAGIKP